MTETIVEDGNVKNAQAGDRSKKESEKKVLDYQFLITLHQ